MGSSWKGLEDDRGPYLTYLTAAEAQTLLAELQRALKKRARVEKALAQP